MPLWPLVRLPSLISGAFVVFCLVLVLVDEAGASHADQSLAPSDTECRYHTAHDPASGTATDYQVFMLRLQLRQHCATNRWDFKQITGGVTPLGAGAKSLADVSTLLSTGNAKRDEVDLNTDQLEAKLDTLTLRVLDLTGTTDQLEAKLDTVASKLDNVEAAIVAQGPNSSGGSIYCEPPADCPNGDDADPVHVKLATSETQLDQAANAGLGALWFLAGLLVVLCVAGAVRKAVMPR